MRAYKLAQIESDFYQNLTDSSGKKHTGLVGTFPYVKRLKPGFDSFYYTEKKTKKGIRIHFTCGTITSDIATLTTKDNHVSVAYVVARSGQVYELFDPSFWAYHLGPSKENLYNNTLESSQTIGIEVSNLGPLKLKDSILYDIYDKEYCTIQDQTLYDKITYRGYDYFASLTEEQYVSVKRLIDDLSAKFSIPHTIMADGHRFDFDPKSAINVGVALHVNYRKDKVDFPPSLDYHKLGF